MKAMKLTDIRHMTMQDVPKPEIQNSDDVLIKIARVGICGSDVHYFSEGGIGTQRVKYPWGVGHEGAGIVEAVGSGVSRVRTGDRIAFDPAMPCGKCDQCVADRPHTCRNLKFLACPDQAEGCLCDYIVMPQASCYVIPETMTFEEAAIVEPLSIGVYAITLSVPMPGATIGILGAGPIGLSVLLPAKAMGAKRVYMTDKIDSRLALASRAGADWTGNVNSADIVAQIAEREPNLLDAVFECSGDQAAIDQAIELLKPGGKLLLIGIPSALRISFDISQMRRKEITVQNVRRQNNCVQLAIDMIANKEIDVNIMVTHRIPFAETQRGFDMVADYQDGVVKAMVTFD